MAAITAKLLEEKILRGIRAKRRFRAAVRHVIYNISWIQEDDDFHYNDPNPKNIRQSISKLKKNKDGHLKLQEISILRKHAKYRTEDDIKLLNKYIGGLKCFRIYPKDVRMEMVKVTYFEYYGPNRTLIKENQSGHALYFLLTGEVLIFKWQFDVALEKYVQVQVNKITAGNMFGEISMLHNVPRTATVITSAPCQLLVLKKDDFDRVLKERLMAQWEEIRDSMLRFVYFDNWTAVKIRECCMLSAIERYKPNEVIYADKKKTKEKSDMVYFVIEGTCAVIEHLFIQETIKHGRTVYKSYVPPELIDVELPLTAPFSLENLEDVRSINKQSTDLMSSISKRSSPTPEFIFKSEISGSDIGIECDDDDPISIVSVSHKSNVNGHKIENKLKAATSLNILQKELNLNEEKLSKRPKIKLPSNVKLRFMQICTFKELATFFEGKLMENRRVISLTPVKVMTIPFYWLTANSKGNVWSRIEEYQKKKIPSNQDVFKAFIKRQKWQEYKRNLRNDILSKKKLYNSTTIHDVPYSIRIMSSYDN